VCLISCNGRLYSKPLKNHKSVKETCTFIAEFSPLPERYAKMTTSLKSQCWSQ